MTPPPGARKLKRRNVIAAPPHHPQHPLYPPLTQMSPGKGRKVYFLVELDILNFS
jgi:hypothetical protein